MLLVQEEKIRLRNKDQIANWVHLETNQPTWERLPYCKRTMQALDGDIYCESEMGEHTAFRLSFPDLVVQKRA